MREWGKIDRVCVLGLLCFFTLVQAGASTSIVGATAIPVQRYEYDIKPQEAAPTHQLEISTASLLSTSGLTADSEAYGREIIL